MASSGSKAKKRRGGRRETTGRDVGSGKRRKKTSGKNRRNSDRENFPENERDDEEVPRTMASDDENTDSDDSEIEETGTESTSSEPKLVPTSAVVQAATAAQAFRAFHTDSAYKGTVCMSSKEWEDQALKFG